jgi:Domain of unknown function (DUF4386)
MNWHGSGRAPQDGAIDARRRTARRAGAWYLIMAIGTAFGMGYVDPLLRASSDGMATASTIRSSVALFHAGIAGTVTGMVAMLFLAGALYELFEGVDRAQARLLVVFVVVGVSITMARMATALVAIGLARGDGFALGLEPTQRIGLMMTSLAAYRFGGLMATVLWGLWLLPFGLLLLRSGFAPRVLGVLMTIGCFAYLLHAGAELFFPAIGPAAAYGLAVPTLGEVGTIAWLLFKGPAGARAAGS